jgi:hypothetical protein
MVDMLIQPHLLLHTEALDITLASLGGKVIGVQITKKCSTIGMLSSAIILKGLLACLKKVSNPKSWDISSN